jgi:Xaa-Pro aminopeptidase
MVFLTDRRPGASTRDDATWNLRHSAVAAWGPTMRNALPWAADVRFGPSHSMTALPGIRSSDLRSRLTWLRSALSTSLGVDAILVTDPANIRYLTNFAGASAGVLVSADVQILLTDGRYRALAHQTVVAPHVVAANIEVVISRDPGAVIRDHLSASARVAIEADHMSVADFDRLGADLGEVTLVPVSNALADARLVKDAGELARIRAAAAITDAALEDLVAAEPIGWTERAVATFLAGRVVALGADAPAFEPIVASAERTAVPHARPGRHRIETGQIVLVDFGSEVDGYKADLSRVLWWGDIAPRLAAGYDAVQHAYREAVAALQVGVTPGEIDERARAVLREYDLEQFMIHPSGHNLGLEIHETPFLHSIYDGRLAAGNTITVEPGIYIPDLGGIRIEDTFVLTDSAAVPLTMSACGGAIASGRSAQTHPPLPGEPGQRTPTGGCEPRPESASVDALALDDHQRFLIGHTAPWPSAEEA